MLKRIFLIGIVLFSICFCLDYKIVVDKLINLNDGKYFIQFYVINKYNKTIFSECWLNNEYLGKNYVFKKTIYFNSDEIIIKCKKDNILIKKIFFINRGYEDKPYNLTIINPNYVKYDNINKFDVYYPNKLCKIKLIINDKSYDMEKTIYGYYTKTIKVNQGDKIKFLVICPGKNYTFYYDRYKYNNIQDFEIKVLDIPKLKTGDYLLLKFYILDKYGHRKYDLENISYYVYDPNNKKIKCNLSENNLGFYLKCYLNNSGKYKIKLCYKDTCIEKTINVSKRINQTICGFEILTPKQEIVYNSNMKNLLFRVFVYGNISKVYERNTGIVFKNESKRIYIAKLPITLGENKFDIVAKCKNLTINKTYIIYASNKTPTIEIYANDTYKLNKSDKIIFFVDVKYNNKTLETGKVKGYIKCGDVITQDEGKFDYDKGKFVLSFYVFSSGDCSITVEYFNKDYVTVKKTKNFKVILDKNYDYSFQITNAIIIAILIVFTAIILVIVLKSVL